VQHLVALEAIGRALVLTMMRFEDELAHIEAFEFAEARTVRPKEFELARSPIESPAASWEQRPGEVPPQSCLDPTGNRARRPRILPSCPRSGRCRVPAARRETRTLEL
jgi:hypothetical protein